MMRTLLLTLLFLGTSLVHGGVVSIGDQPLQTLNSGRSNLDPILRFSILPQDSEQIFSLDLTNVVITQNSQPIDLQDLLDSPHEYHCVAIEFDVLDPNQLVLLAPNQAASSTLIFQGSSGVAVPEPTSFSLWLVGMVTVLTIRRRS